MLEPVRFIQKIQQIQGVIRQELTFYQTFFEEPGLRVNGFEELLAKLTQDEVVRDLKKRTITLLRLYVFWFKKNDVHAKGYHMTMFQDISYEILLLIEEDFHLYKRNELFFDIIHSLVANDFKPIFRHSFPFEDPYEVAYDLLSFSLHHPPRDTKLENHDNIVDIDIYTIGSGRHARFQLHVYPKGNHVLFHRLDVDWSENFEDEHVSVFVGTDKEKPYPFFTHKKQLLNKYAKPIIVELMFQMEYNREFWGVKHFLAQKLFLQSLISTFK